MWLIIGANGKIGGHLVRICQDQGTPCRLGVRDLDAASEEFGSDADVVLFDYDLPHSYSHALKDVDKVFFIAPTADAPDHVEGIIAQMEDKGIRQVVFSSGRTTGDIPGTPLNRAEQLLKGSSLSHTILRPGWFMQNFLGWIGLTILQEGKFYLPAGDSQSAFVDVRDIAAVAHAILQDGGYSGRVLELTSEEALNHFEVAQKISTILGKRVHYIPLTDDEYLQKMKSLGWTDSSARKMVTLYETVRTGKESEISYDIKEVLGRAPHTFDQFLQDHYQQFRQRYLGSD